MSVIEVMNMNENLDIIYVSQRLILSQFIDVFLEELSGLTARKEVKSPLSSI